MNLEQIIRDPRVSQLSVRVKHGSNDIIIDAFWAGSLQIVTGFGPTVEAAVSKISAEIQRRSSVIEPTVDLLPILPGDIA